MFCFFHFIVHFKKKKKKKRKCRQMVVKSRIRLKCNFVNEVQMLRINLTASTKHLVQINW